MQATARSRRLFQLRGSTSAVQGRHRLASTVVVQMAVGEDDETEGGIMRHKLPNKKKRSHLGSDSEHSLQSAVIANRKTKRKDYSCLDIKNINTNK